MFMDLTQEFYFPLMCPFSVLLKEVVEGPEHLSSEAARSWGVESHFRKVCWKWPVGSLDCQPTVTKLTVLLAHCPMAPEDRCLPAPSGHRRVDIQGTWEEQVAA